MCRLYFMYDFGFLELSEAFEVSQKQVKIIVFGTAVN